MEKKDKKNLSFISYDFFRKSPENQNLDIRNLNYTFVKYCLGVNNLININNKINEKLLNNLNKKLSHNTNLIQDEWIILDEK